MPTLLRTLALASFRKWAAAHEGETPPGSNLGPFVKMVLQPVGLESPQPYCAATMSFAFYSAAKTNGVAMPFAYTAGALKLFHECQDLGFEIDKSEIQPEDLVVWHRGPNSGGLGHIEIVEFGLNPNGNIQTVGANHSSKIDHFHYDHAAWTHNFVGALRIPG
jgi:hypothetical protein